MLTDGVVVRAEAGDWRRKAGRYELDSLAVRALCCHRGSPLATSHVVMGAVVLTISGSPGLELLSGRAWDKANFQAWSAQLRAFNQIPGIRQRHRQTCHVKLLPRTQTQIQTQTQTRHPRTHGLSVCPYPLRETSRDGPPLPWFMRSHHTCHCRKRPRAVFSLSLQQQGVKEERSQVRDGRRLPPKLNLEPLDV